MKIKVAAACIPDMKGDRDANLAAALAMIRKLAGAGAQIVVLPEACLQGLPSDGSDLTVEELRRLAEPFDGRYATAFREAAAKDGVYLVAAYDRRDGDRVYNTAELIGPDGKTIGLYDKTHGLDPPGQDYYTPGRSLPVFDTEFGKVGILICMDRVFAENWRVLMLQGARLVLIPANGGCSQANTHRLQAMAFDQGLPNVFAHPRRGLVIDVNRNIVDRDENSAKPYALGELDLGEVDLRQEELRSLRRPDLYGLVADR